MTLGNVTLTMPGAGVGDNSLFGSRSPKGDAIKAVKLTKANAHEVSKHIAEEVKVDIVEVDLDHEVLRCSTKSRGSVLSASTERVKSMIHYAVAYDRPAGKGVSTVHLGDFRALIDASSLIRQLTDEGRRNIRVRAREISEYVDALTAEI
jgi:hypothetical protein